MRQNDKKDKIKGEKAMTNRLKMELYGEIRVRYLRSTKSDKTAVLDEYTRLCSYNRKYAIRKLNKPEKEPAKQKSGNKKKYDNPEMQEILKLIWKKMNLPCSKILVAGLPTWIVKYEDHIGEEIKEEVKILLLTISARTIDRIFSPFRKKYKKRGLCTTKPGSIIKKRIPIKTNQWDEKRPGFIESDTVAHCGESTAGTYVNTLTTTDIATGWTELRSIWGKGAEGVNKSLKDIENRLCFDILGFDSDNGSEFINYHIYYYFIHRKRPVQFTRSREYHKNDNAHVEQKNWSVVRQYVGYERFDKQETVTELNDLYVNHLCKLINFFIPSFKLISKERIGSKIVKRYDKPKTPYERLMESEYISASNKILLSSEYNLLDPFGLQRNVVEKMKKVNNRYRS
jgi:hypothetical protein